MMPSDSSYIPQAQPAPAAVRTRRTSIGLPACASTSDRRFPLTPEGAAILVERGFDVRIQSGAAADIHYPDSKYLKAGASVVSRQEALSADIVIHLAPLGAADIRMMRRGAMLLSILHAEQLTAENVRELLNRNIIAVAIDLMRDREGHTPFYDILMEVDGRASMTLAASMFASKQGKGILLGGVAGVNPCEVTILGSGIAAIAAAGSALGLGAKVNIFDSDVYRIRAASRLLGQGVSISSPHPQVLEKALRTADAVIATPQSRGPIIGADLVEVMKKGVVVMDIDYDTVHTFPSLPAVDISTADHAAPTDADGRRICYINLGNAVPRTAAMALTDTLLCLMDEIMSCEGAANTVKLLPGLQCAVYTFLGKPVNRRVADIVKMRPIDISLLLNCS